MSNHFGSKVNDVNDWITKGLLSVFCYCVLTIYCCSTKTFAIVAIMSKCMRLKKRLDKHANLNDSFTMHVNKTWQNWREIMRRLIK